MLTLTYALLNETVVKREARADPMRGRFVAIFRRADRDPQTGAFVLNRQALAAMLLAAVDRRGALEARRIATIAKARYQSASESAKTWAQNRAVLIVDSANNASQQAVARALEGAARVPGWTSVEGLKDRLRGSVTGLTERDGRAVGNFMLKLSEDPSLSVAQIERAAETYSKQLLEKRIDNIARTELAEARSRGQREAWTQARVDGRLTSQARRTWRVGANPCQICEPMDGQSVGLTEDFTTGLGDTVQAPPAHPNCECSQELTESQTES